MKISIEMGPKEFTLSTRVNGFQVDEDVDIVLQNAIALTGRVESTKDATYGAQQTPCTRIKIAVTSSNIVRHFNKTLSGATVTGKRSGAQGTIYGRDPNKYSHPMVKRQYLTGIVNEVETLVDRASRDKDDARARQWFGDGLTNVQLQGIHSNMAVMREGLAAVAVMRFVCISTVTVAACDLDNRLRYKPTTCQILLGKGFTYQRYSWGEKVCTLAHELSHWFLDTTDETYLGEDAYGVKAFDMAADPSVAVRRQCLKNAENWGYYISSYRNGNDGNDWSNMTRQELALREPFNAEVQRVEPAIIHSV